MFDVIEIDASAFLQDAISVSAIVPPVLKGLLGGEAGRSAVFISSPGAVDYVTVAVGESVANYRVVAIGEDFVTAVSPAGEEVRFQLRGVGEGH